jgi:hypothetical protein
MNIYANMHNLVQKLVPFLVFCIVTEEWAANPDSPGTDLCGQKNSPLIPNKYDDFHIHMDYVILYGFTEGK